ncbi:MAG: hypothetical protein U0T77_11300 [Chitinophagales bacterium]
MTANKLYLYIITIFLLSCKKDNTTTTPELTDPQLIAHLDSMLSAVGVATYSDILYGKLEGNFDFYSHYYPYDVNCSTDSIPFNINTNLSGGISLDTNNRFNLINGGDLYVNDIKITPEINTSYQYIYFAKAEIMPDLDKIYGKINQIKIVKDDVTVLNTSLFIPKNIIMMGIDCSSGMFPDNSLKANFKIEWNKDVLNKNGVVIELLGKDNSGAERYSYILVPDIGYYRFSDVNLNRYPKEKNPLGIDIKLIRGNFVFLYGNDNRRYSFSFVTSCSYLFRQ